MIRLLSLAALVVAFASAAPSNAQVLTYVTDLAGGGEGSGSPGTGFARVDYDPIAHTLSLDTNFSGLLGTTTASHIHSPTTLPFTGNAGVATQLPSFVGFPLGVTSGSYSETFDLTMASSWNPAFITAQGGTPATAEAAFASHLSTGRAYLNIHTSQFTGGEIRGYFALIPEPATLGLAGIGALGLLLARRSSRRG